MRKIGEQHPLARNALPGRCSIAVVAIVAMFLAGCEPQETKKLMTRAELQRLIMGKTKDQVFRAIGRPQSTSSRLDVDGEFWYFSGIDYDPVSLKIDTFTQVVFKNYSDGARVIQVNH